MLLTSALLLQPLSGDEIQRALSQAKVTHPAQQKVINSVLNALKADNDTVKVGAFAETDIKIFLKHLVITKIAVPRFIRV